MTDGPFDKMDGFIKAIRYMAPVRTRSVWDEHFLVSPG